jgi:hypothetical protein
MKKILLSVLAALALVAVSHAGETVTAELKRSEIEGVIDLMGRLGVASVTRNARCSEATVEITSTVRQMNPASWVATFTDGENEQTAGLSGDEKSLMIQIFNRAEVPATHFASGGFLKSQATLRFVECKGRADEWTISYQSRD